MKRRDFVKTGALITSLPFLNNLLFSKNIILNSSKLNFNLNYAPHFGMFKHHAGDDLIDQIQFMYDYGFKAIEDNGMKSRSKSMQEKISKKLQTLGMSMGVFIGSSIDWEKPTLTTGIKEFQNKFLNDLKESIEVAKRVNATWMTIVPGVIDLKQEIDYQTVNLIEILKKGCELLEPHGLIMVLEPLNWWTNHPGQFLKKIPQAYKICKSVNSPSCKILFDIYHQQISEGNIIPNFEKSWSEIAYIQIGDNPGRNEPTTGEINYKNIFKYLHNKEYKGILGMEHGNSIKGKKGENKIIEAYREVDNFAI